MKLIIELDIDRSDFSEEDAQRFLTEADAATGISVEVGRPIEDEDSDGPSRVCSLTTEYFKTHLTFAP